MGQAIFWCLSFALLIQYGRSMTTSQQEMAETSIHQLIAQQHAPDGNLPFIAGLVRLAFHDCVGGCDGCINSNIAGNAGLSVYTGPMDTVYSQDNISRLMSRADFYALGGMMAAELGATVKIPCKSFPCGKDPAAKTPPMTFRTGRVSCGNTSSSSNPNEFPNAHGDPAHVLDYLKRTFGFTARESVCIMGGHSVGEAHSSASGFRGPWVARKSVLNNQFYSDLKERDWRQINVGTVPNPSNQWTIRGQQQGGHLMLNTDIALLKNFSVDNSGAANCNFSACSSSSTASFVTEFANDNEAWLNCFGEAFEKMLESSGDGQRLTLKTVVNDDNDDDDDNDNGVKGFSTIALQIFTLVFILKYLA